MNRFIFQETTPRVLAQSGTQKFRAKERLFFYARKNNIVVIRSRGRVIQIN